MSLRRAGGRGRLFCSPREAALFLGLSHEAVKKRVQRGTLPGVARAVDGSLWRADASAGVLIEAAAVRRQLHPEDQMRFDAWRNGKLSLAAVGRQLERERGGSG